MSTLSHTYKHTHAYKYTQSLKNALFFTEVFVLINTYHGVQVMNGCHLVIITNNSNTSIVFRFTVVSDCRSVRIIHISPPLLHSYRSLEKFYVASQYTADDLWVYRTGKPGHS